MKGRLRGPGAGERSPLADPSWRYIDKPTLDAFGSDDWKLLNRQRTAYHASQQARQVLRILECSRDDATFGYPINIFRHSLQSATRAMRDGQDEETIVVALLHDIGFGACPQTHGEFSAALLAPYISERNHWMLRHHAIFQQFHVHEDPAVDRDQRERWRGHPFFGWTAEFVEKYDQNAIRADYDPAPIEAFEPMVQRVFARAPRPES